MTERFTNNAEREARKEVEEIYKTLGIPRADTGPDAKLWLDLLRRTRNRFEKFRYKYSGNIGLFVPHAYEEDHDEQLRFSTQDPSVGYQPAIRWLVLQKKSETRELFTAILSLQNGEPGISLMRETFSIFLVRGLKIDNIMSKWVPRMASQTAVIKRGQDAYFDKEELGQRTEHGYIPIEEALSRFDIPN